MNWEAINAISETIGAIAVIVTLIYLARQIAMSNKFAAAEAWRSRFNEFTSINAAYGVNPVFYHANVKIHKGDLMADLNGDEQALINSWVISMLQIYEQLFREVRTGILDPAALDEYPGASTFLVPFFKEQWPFYRAILLPAFTEFLEEKYKLL